MREELNNKLEAILKEKKSNQSASTVTSSRFDVNEIQDTHASGSKIDKSRGVRASNNENPDYESDEYPLRASKMKDIKKSCKTIIPK